MHLICVFVCQGDASMMRDDPATSEPVRGQDQDNADDDGAPSGLSDDDTGYDGDADDDVNGYNDDDNNVYDSDGVYVDNGASSDSALSDVCWDTVDADDGYNGDNDGSDDVDGAPSKRKRSDWLLELADQNDDNGDGDAPPIPVDDPRPISLCGVCCYSMCLAFLWNQLLVSLRQLYSSLSISVLRILREIPYFRPFLPRPGGSRREQISRDLLVRLSRHSDDTVTRKNLV